LHARLELHLLLPWCTHHVMIAHYDTYMTTGWSLQGAFSYACWVAIIHTLIAEPAHGRLRAVQHIYYGPSLAVPAGVSVAKLTVIC
jgi:hypothetical protein